MNAAASLYVGQVMHRRLRPKRHALKHACYWMLLDLDRIDEATGASVFFSRNRFNALSFYDRDFGDGGALPLRSQIDTRLRAQGIEPPAGAYRLFCMPRVLGYGFNPLSVYFCHDKADDLRAIAYEVHNTFGERHYYCFAVEGEEKSIRHGCDKDFYVSPFMDMELNYDFRVTQPDKTITIGIHTSDSNGLMLFAGLSGQRRELSNGSIARLSLSHPLLTIKVIAAIHIHAAILWWKGVRIRRWKAGMRRAPGAIRPT